MKKIAIAGASVALAAMPVVGVFAVPTPEVLTQTDDIEITIDEVCSIGYNDGKTSPVINVPFADHTDGAGTWAEQGSTSTNPDVPDHDTLSVTMSTGTSSENLGSTTLAIYCNHEAGYTITASGIDTMTGTNGNNSISDTIPVSSTISTSASGWSYKVAIGSKEGSTEWSQRGEIKNGHTTWAAAGTSTDPTANPVANQIIAGSPASGTKTTTNDGDYYVITYGAGIDETQSAGTYTGTATYTLSEL